jgi:hypothetical protein
LAFDNASQEELQLVAEGRMRLPVKKLDLRALFKMPTAKVRGNAAVKAHLAERL